MNVAYTIFFAVFKKINVLKYIERYVHIELIL